MLNSLFAVYLPICQSVSSSTSCPYFAWAYLISLCMDPLPLLSHKLFENWEHLCITVYKARNATQSSIEWIHGRKRYFICIQIVPLKPLRVMISLAVASVSSFMRNQKRSENRHIWLGIIGFPMPGFIWLLSRQCQLLLLRMKDKIFLKIKGKCYEKANATFSPWYPISKTLPCFNVLFIR